MVNLIQNCDILFHELSYGPIITDMDRDALRQPESKLPKLQNELLSQERTKARWDKIIASAAFWKHRFVCRESEHQTACSNSYWRSI